jgi:hypothetical protein
VAKYCRYAFVLPRSRPSLRFPPSYLVAMRAAIKAGSGVAGFAVAPAVVVGAAALVADVVGSAEPVGSPDVRPDAATVGSGEPPPVSSVGPLLVQAPTSSVAVRPARVARTGRTLESHPAVPGFPARSRSCVDVFGGRG